MNTNTLVSRGSAQSPLKLCVNSFACKRSFEVRARARGRALQLSRCCTPISKTNLKYCVAHVWRAHSDHNRTIEWMSCVASKTKQRQKQKQKTEIDLCFPVWAHGEHGMDCVWLEAASSCQKRSSLPRSDKFRLKRSVASTNPTEIKEIFLHFHAFPLFFSLSRCVGWVEWEGTECSAKPVKLVTRKPLRNASRSGKRKRDGNKFLISRWPLRFCRAFSRLNRPNGFYFMSFNKSEWTESGQQRMMRDLIQRKMPDSN